MKSRNFFLLFFIVISFSGVAQSSSLGDWLIYFGNKKLNDKWNIHHEVQYRNYNIAGDLEQLLLRAGVGYNLSENNNNVLIGYGFIHSENYQDTSNTKTGVNEHRIYQQFITKQSFGRFSLQHRYRIEERFVEDDFLMRFRYFLAAKVALNKPKIEDNTFYLSAYNELFIHGQNTYFDRNRIYGGLGFALKPSLKFELGYMSQIFQNSCRDQVNVICSWSF